MKISTWNLERPTSRTDLKNTFFVETIKQLSPDILVLTESNLYINTLLNYPFVTSSMNLSGVEDPVKYKDGECRTTILSRYPFGKRYDVQDDQTTCCQEIITPFGSLIIYATIFGILGGTDPKFHEQVNPQLIEIAEFQKSGSLCVVGDLNISFSGRAYPGKVIIASISDFFKSQSLTIVTRDLENIPDHIVLSESFIQGKQISGPKQGATTDHTDHCWVSIDMDQDESLALEPI